MPGASLELAREVIDELAQCETSFRRICEQKQTHPGHLLALIVRDPQLSAQYARVKEVQIEALAEEIIEISDEEPTCEIVGDGWSKTAVDPAGIQRNRLRVDTRKWIMSKIVPKKYGDKIPGDSPDNPLHLKVEDVRGELISKLSGGSDTGAAGE